MYFLIFELMASKQVKQTAQNASIVIKNVKKVILSATRIPPGLLSGKVLQSYYVHGWIWFLAYKMDFNEIGGRCWDGWTLLRWVEFYPC